MVGGRGIHLSAEAVRDTQVPIVPLGGRSTEDVTYVMSCSHDRVLLVSASSVWA